MPPSFSATRTEVGEITVAVPKIGSTLFLRNRNRTPSVSPLTTSSLRASIAGRSSRRPSNWMPCFLNRSFDRWNSSLESSIALLGMQPTFRHVPPSVRPFSTQATFMPSCAARIAAT